MGLNYGLEKRQTLYYQPVTLKELTTDRKYDGRLLSEHCVMLVVRCMIICIRKPPFPFKKLPFASWWKAKTEKKICFENYPDTWGRGLSQFTLTTRDIFKPSHVSFYHVDRWDQSLIPSTYHEVLQLTMTLKMTTAQVVETSVTVNNNSPIQDYVHPDDHTQPIIMMKWLLASNLSKFSTFFLQALKTVFA